MPAGRTSCWMSWARSGISKPFQVSSFTVKPLGLPAASSSCLALATSRWRCSTFAVDLNTGAKGLSLPKSDFVSSRPFTSDCRLTSSAMAWRTRLSSSGSLSVRMWIWRCDDARSSVVMTFGSVSSALPPDTEYCTSTSTSLPWKPRTWDCSSG